MQTVVWKRLDSEGHDACRFVKTVTGWTIEGSAFFEHAEQAVNLAYRLVCDRQWESLQASVVGWIGKTEFRMDIEREDDGSWCINGKKNNALTGLKDIDLGFTPATNTIAIRRLNLSTGNEAETVAVWLDTGDWTVKPLRQRYRRTQNHGFDYESPQNGYLAPLVVDDFGAVTEYPELWVMLYQTNA